MATGVSLFFLAVGAILTFAVHTTVSGIDLDTIGVILMVVGLLGLLFSLVLFDSWRPGSRRNDDLLVEEDPAPRRTTRRVYR